MEDHLELGQLEEDMQLWHPAESDAHVVHMCACDPWTSVLSDIPCSNTQQRHTWRTSKGYVRAGGRTRCMCSCGPDLVPAHAHAPIDIAEGQHLGQLKGN